MIKLQAERNKLVAKKKEMLVSGSVNVYSCRFDFSEDWDGLARTAVFKAGQTAISILLDESGECVVPWEVLDGTCGEHLRAGLFGTSAGEIVLPTVWTDLGYIYPGVNTDTAAGLPPTPDIHARILAAAESASEAAADTRSFIENLTVEAKTLAPGSEASVEKTVENGHAKLIIGVPAGEKGEPGEDASAMSAAISNSWILPVAASAWVSDSDTWAGMTASYKAEITAEGITEATMIDVVNFVSGDLTAASQWLYLRTGDGVVTLWSDAQPTADFTLRIMEVK